jgi:hypothetical protein
MDLTFDIELRRSAAYFRLFRAAVAGCISMSRPASIGPAARYRRADQACLLKYSRGLA